MIKHRSRLMSSIFPAHRYAAHFTSVFPTALTDIASMMRHPRSLARSIPTWRPPSIQLPPPPGEDPLVLTLSRHRAGPAARKIVREFGENRQPAYLITVRITNPMGYKVSNRIAEGWVRAILGSTKSSTVHQLTDEPTPTFCWLIDAHFDPVPSPSSLFEYSNKNAA
ncbi:hypothetical protein [Corynebacterium crudilactis]|uniref:Uncharacterized protein n=1 Tax=Corynebacterium crudilactis TaxID=1652495 RepID=A0A172QX62_9CORY|nr:hypothetical protein [Corynebacterium crudilactis]ANE05297.1 hypothetical protein ccrud_05485 [Corynebacterium crudilactis]